MYNWYGVLGIGSGASDEEIEAGVLRTITELHPDRSAPPDPRLRLVIRAYETLTDPARRSAYDAALASRYAQIRQAKRSKAMTFATTCATTFALTVCCALTVVLWGERGETLALDRAPTAASEVLAASPQVAVKEASVALAAPQRQGGDSPPQGRLLR